VRTRVAESVGFPMREGVTNRNHHHREPLADQRHFLRQGEFPAVILQQIVGSFAALGMTGKGHSVTLETQGCATFNIDRLHLQC